MTRTNNDELVEIALRIAAKDAESKRYREMASSFPELRLEQRAWSLDDDICQLCTELRNACLSVAA